MAFSFQPGNVESLARLLEFCSPGEADLALMGQRSACMAQCYSPDQWADSDYVPCVESWPDRHST